MPRFVDRTGEERLSLQGSLMRIIAYRSSHDVDVLFVDSGYIARNKSYGSFKAGLIADKSVKRQWVNVTPESVRRSHFVGKVYFNKLYNMNMTIVDYKSNEDVKVRFKDGYVKESVKLDSVKNGTVFRDDYIRMLDENNEVYYAKISSLVNNMTVDTKDCGKAILVGWLDIDNVDVRLEDGTIVRCSFNKFKRGLVKKPKVGEERINNHGLKMRIIAYRGCNDIDVEFEDGSRVCNTTYFSFSHGTLRKPFDGSGYVDKVYNSWKIVSVTSPTCVDAECLCCNKLYSNLSLYDLKDGRSKMCRSCSSMLARHNYWGTKAKENLSGKVIGDFRVIQRKSQGIWDVECIYCSTRRSISTDSLYSKKSSPKCKCQSNIRYDGIAFSTVMDLHGYLIDKYDEGAIGYVALCKLVGKGDFEKITEMCQSKSKFGCSYTKDRIGETVVMYNGQSATIIDMANGHDITVKFEDGTVVNGQYRNFRRGVLRNPNLMLVSSKTRPDVVVKGSNVGSFDVLDFAYRLTDARDVFYICSCRCCGCKDILSPSQMLKHSCSAVQSI